MAGRKRKLEQAVAVIQRQHGAKALRRGIGRAPKPELSISTSFSQLDTLTGCNGIPLGAMSLMSGRSTSGKTTVAYKLLANAQGKAGQGTPTTVVALVDMVQTANPDYLARCGIEVDNLLAHYTEEEIISHCLYEMTFYGHTLEAVTEHQDRLSSGVSS